MDRTTDQQDKRVSAHTRTQARDSLLECLLLPPPPPPPLVALPLVVLLLPLLLPVAVGAPEGLDVGLSAAGVVLVRCTSA